MLKGLAKYLVIVLLFALFANYILNPALKTIFKCFLLLGGIAPFVLFMALGVLLKSIYDKISNTKNKSSTSTCKGRRW